PSLHTTSLHHSTATPLLSTPSLHDALPICSCCFHRSCRGPRAIHRWRTSRGRWSHRNSRAPIRLWGCRCSANTVKRNGRPAITIDRKSTRLNSSHVSISYAVFCLKKKMNRVAAAQRDLETLSVERDPHVRAGRDRRAL